MSDQPRIREIIPPKFWRPKSGPPPIGRTVGELRAILDELPAELPIIEACEVVVANIAAGLSLPPHVYFREPFHEDGDEA